MIEDIIAGLQIIQKYNPKSLVYAEHDQIYAGCELHLFSSEDKEKLEAFGWFMEDENEGWSKFV